MSLITAFVEQQGKVVDGMIKALAQIPQDKLFWKPYGKALPWMPLISHTCVHRIAFLKSLKGEPFKFPAMFREPEYQVKNVEEAIELARRSWEDLVKFLESKPEDFVKEKIKPYWGGPEVSVARVMWFIFEESVHHRGQAWIYARMNGITPPTIWGTEQP